VCKSSSYNYNESYYLDEAYIICQLFKMSQNKIVCILKMKAMCLIGFNGTLIFWNSSLIELNFVFSESYF